jgi:DNA-binding NarL/FixJ family response regulator
MTGPIRVLIADDHALMREGIRHVLDDPQLFVVVAEAARGDEVVPLARKHEPDVVVLDISMPGRSGLEVTPLLRDAVPACRIIILSMHEHGEYVLRAVRAGAHGYVLKDAPPAHLRAAVQAVHRGEEAFGADITQTMNAALRVEAQSEQRRGALLSLTGRERDVLAQIAEGKTNKEIAAVLGISPRTVEAHRESLMRKLEIRSVAGLTRFAIDAGLITS